MTVADYFTSKNVFITGGNGFLGNLIIEKLLRSCPGIGNIYVLLRPKKRILVEERLKKMIASPVFNPLRHLNPDAFKKIIPIKGDVSELNLGLSEEDRELLVNTVNIIYHSAASVRFDDFLKDAIILNVRGTREVAKLALDLKNISIFVHISTGYCNCDKSVIEEKLYPAHFNWTDAIKLAEEGDQQLLEIITQKFIYPLPNTYTFAKSLGEHVVNDMCRGVIPAVIIRPTIVMNTFEEPIMAYSANFNGPVGYIVGGGKGVSRTVYGKKETKLDSVPADFVIKGIILATQAEGVKTNSKNIEVYNLSDNHIDIMLSDIVSTAMKICDTAPFSQIVWHHSMSVTDNFYLFYIRTLLYQMPLALLIDFILNMTGKKPRLLSVQRKMFIVSTVLYPFAINTYRFLNDKYISIQINLKKEDYVFSFDYKPWTREEIYDYFKNCKIGTAKYVLNENIDMSTSEQKSLIQKFWLIDRIFKILLLLFTGWITISKLRFLNLASAKCVSYFCDL